MAVQALPHGVGVTMMFLMSGQAICRASRLGEGRGSHARLE
jgi:hypothetical protein